MRFALKIGPIIGIIGWLMASSGQGSMNDLFTAAKQWSGLEDGGGVAAGNIPAGIAGLANLFDNKKSSTGSRSSSRLVDCYPFGRHDRHKAHADSNRRKTAKKDPNVMESLFQTAADVAQKAENGNWQGVIQDYVKQAVQKSLGFEWPLGDSDTKDSNTRRRTRSR